MKRNIIKILMVSSVLGTVVSLATYNNQVVVNANEISTVASQKEEDVYDISTGWIVTEFSSSTGISADKFFMQGSVNENLNQKMTTANFGNIGKTNFTAEKIIPMKKGLKYNVKLVYAMYYNLSGKGYIDFNGDRKEADNDHTDKEYTDTIVADKDMNYKITIHFEVPNNSTAKGYFKLGYDKDEGGFTPEETAFPTPELKDDLEANQKTIEGTAVPKNTVTVMDSEDNKIGENIVKDDGTFNIETDRLLIYNEKLYISQTNGNITSPVKEVTVVDTVAPDKPEVNAVTDEDKEISGKAEPGSLVKAYVKDTPSHYYRSKADEDGNYSINLDSPYTAGTELGVVAVDSAENISEEANTTVSYAKALDLEELNGISSRDSYLEGKASRGNTLVQITFHDAVTYETETDEEGYFSIDVQEAQVVGSEYVIELKHKASGETKEFVKRVLPIPPIITVLQENQNILEGNVDPGAEVLFTLISDGSEQEFTTKADTNGNFKLVMKDDEDENIYLKIGDTIKCKTVLTIDGDSLESIELSYSVYTRKSANVL